MPSPATAYDTSQRSIPTLRNSSAGESLVDSLTQLRGNRWQKRLRVLRSLLLRGDHISAGREIEVSALDAQLLLESTRAELVDPSDMAIVRDAVRTDVAAILRREKSPLRPRP